MGAEESISLYWKCAGQHRTGPGRHADRQRDRQTDGQTNRQMDKQADRRQAGRRAGGQTTDPGKARQIDRQRSQCVSRPSHNAKSQLEEQILTLQTTWASIYLL